MATRVCVLDGGDPKDSENTLNSFLTKRDGNAFWQIGADMEGSDKSKDMPKIKIESTVFTNTLANLKAAT